MHGSQHARDKLVDSVALLNQGHQGRDSTLVVPHVSEVREDELLKLLNLVLQDHEVRDRFVALVGIIDGFQAEILLVFESPVELWVLLMER